MPDPYQNLNLLDALMYAAQVGTEVGMPNIPNTAYCTVRYTRASQHQEALGPSLRTGKETAPQIHTPTL